MSAASSVKYSGLKSSKSSSRTEKKSRSGSRGSGTPRQRSEKRRPCHEVDCGECGHPCTSKDNRQPATGKCQSLRKMERDEYRIKTEIKISGVGAIPVLKGDPKWLPAKVQNFVAEKARLMLPMAIYICNGSVFEAEEMLEILKRQGTVESLSDYPNVHLARTDPADTARVEKATFISHSDKRVVQADRDSSTPCEFARFMSPEALEVQLDARFPGCMRGRIMYVIPFSMGPIAGRFSRCAVQLTDSPYVVLNMRVMTRVCSSVWDAMGTDDFVRCIHSVGLPRPVFRKMKHNWPCTVDRILIAHRLSENEAWSFGSGYGGNSLLGKKALSLRLAGFAGRKEGWLAEHAAILSITNPSGQESFVTFHAPSSGGKTVLALGQPALEGWKIKVIGDDIAWIRVGEDGRLYAMNPENGMFGIADGLDPKRQPAAIRMLSKNALLVNTASTSKGRMFWKGLESTLEENEKVIDWQGLTWNQTHSNPPAHPNSRFTCFVEQCPTAHELWDSPKGVPISAMIFCSRRPDDFPLCFESDGWEEGVTVAAAMRAEAGSGTDRKVAGLVPDPMGMRAFLAYNFADYVKHWLTIGKKAKIPPKIFHVNWFRNRADGQLVWPGFGENIRVLEWILARSAEQRKTEKPSVSAENASKVPGGYVPKTLNAQNLDASILEAALGYDKEFWKKEVAYMRDFFAAETAQATPAEVSSVLQKMEALLNEEKLKEQPHKDGKDAAN